MGAHSMTKKSMSSEDPASQSATTADAQLILQLYDFRREAEMRKARHFISAEFWPESAEDTLRLARQYPSTQNTWLRQVTSYWEMAVSLCCGAHGMKACFLMAAAKCIVFLRNSDRSFRRFARSFPTFW